ncbi:SDR family oxidoreductase [Nocardia sp. NBC_01327]|uniref:SDR family oxidoreductase n=1 Tax=Nocardia sp. NBC_01327 TaxID=2903593 RepID=UPI002E0EC5A9|nr:SDR family oxidoreductase [Nocardia sp. NBC_01327]
MADTSVALVTGGSRGIGRAIATRLAVNGAQVVVNYRDNADAAREVVADIEAVGGRAAAVRADITDADQLRSVFDFAAETFGGLDILVANAGIARFAPLAEATDDDFDTLFRANTRATFLALREATHRLRDGGRIIVISSGATVTSRPGTALYAASKAAVEQLARVAARELGPRGITVNSVLPGATRTDALETQVSAAALAQAAEQIPLGRLGLPDDIAAIVGFLASAEGGWITGQTIHAGGLF